MASESGCPLEIHHIEIEKCDEMYDKDCQADKNLSMPFYRANYDRITGQSPNTPREQVIKLYIYIYIYIYIYFFKLLGNEYFCITISFVGK